MEEMQKTTTATMPKRQGSVLFTWITPEGATLTGAARHNAGELLFLGKRDENATAKSIKKLV
jgi:hypothetical protein